MITTIQIDDTIKRKLDKLKIHPRETYQELISRLMTGCSPSTVDRESLIETIDVLSNPETMKDIAEAVEEYNNGKKGKTLEEIKKELKL
jgi:hypothetical protein